MNVVFVKVFSLDVFLGKVVLCVQIAWGQSQPITSSMASKRLTTNSNRVTGEELSDETRDDCIVFLLRVK